MMMKEAPLSLQRPAVLHVLWIPCQVLSQHFTSPTAVSSEPFSTPYKHTCLVPTSWLLISFQVIPIFSSHLHCATSQKSHLHSHQHIGCLKVLHCHLLLSSFALGFIHTSSTYDSPLLILHSPLQTFQFNVPHRHFRPNVLKTKLITLNFFIKIHFSVSPASCVAGLGDNSSSRVHSL